jgi:hypothetical protein
VWGLMQGQQNGHMASLAIASLEFLSFQFGLSSQGKQGAGDDDAW